MNIDNYPLDFKHLYVSCFVGAFFMVNRLKGYKVENICGAELEQNNS